MRQLIAARPLRVPIPSCNSCLGIFLLAAVGFLEAFRLVLLKPVLDRVLAPSTGSENIVFFTIPNRAIRSTCSVSFRRTFTMRGPSWRMLWWPRPCLKGCFDYVGTYLVNHAGFGMITNLRNDLYDSVLRRSAAFFQKHTTGTLISTIINDIERVQYAMSSMLAEFLQQFFTFALHRGCWSSCWASNWHGFFSCSFPSIIFSAVRIGRRVRSTTRTGQDQLADIQNILARDDCRQPHRESLRNGVLGDCPLPYRRPTLVPRQSTLGGRRRHQLPIDGYFGAIAIALLLLLGRDQIAHNQLTLGAFVAFVAAVLSMYNPVRKFAVFNNSFQQALGASSQLFKFMDTEDVVREKPGAKALPRFSHGIQFENVCFSYQADGEDSREILHGINLEVRRGEILAIVGSSGAGKSTLVHLLPRFFDVTAGKILVDGHDVRDVTLSLVALSNRDRDPGNGAIQRHGAQQHRLRPAARSDERGGSRCPGCARSRLHLKRCRQVTIR